MKHDDFEFWYAACVAMFLAALVLGVSIYHHFHPPAPCVAWFGVCV